MATFIKAQAASLAATGFDFLTTIVLVNFMVGRLWAFNASEGKIEWQFIKYVLVWTGNLLLNAAGVFIITRYIGFNYVVSKVITSVVVGIGYNYVLQKTFVFR
jgi:putative flippase GtrA